MLRIYHVTGTRGTRVIWLCEELGVEYQVEKIDFSPAYRRSPEWRALNPVGKVPVMSDANGTLFESGAMVQYLLDRNTPNTLQPDRSAADYGLYLQWFWFAEATLARPLGEIVNHGRAFPDEQKIVPVVEEMAARAVDCLQAVADHVQGKRFILGDTFTAADIMLGYSIMLAEMLIPDQIPQNLLPYWQNLQSRPALQIARAA